MSVHTLGVCIALLTLTPGALGQGNRQQRQPKKAEETFTCAMHPSIRIPGAGACPLCGMRLVRVRREPERQPIEVPDGKLQEFCDDFLDRAMKRVEQLEHSQSVPIHLAILTFGRVHGDGARKPLRSLLESPNLECVAWAATVLGRLGDRSALPAMRRLLADQRLRLRFRYYCSRHPEKKHSASAESCSVCARDLTVSIDGPQLVARLALAGAIHRMGGPLGFSVLKQMLDDPFGSMAHADLALRDTPEVRRILSAALTDKREGLRDSARAARLQLGILDDLDAALVILNTTDRLARERIVQGLGAVTPRSAAARQSLRGFVARQDLPRGERAQAAVFLAAAGDAHYRDFILDAVTRAPHDADAYAEISALGEVGSKKDLFVLERIIEKSPENRVYAVFAVLHILARHRGRKDRSQK